MTHKYALPEPPPVATAPEDGTVLEIARVWINPKAPTLVVRAAFHEPEAMGQMLAEVCWNFAAAYEQKGGFTQREALEALRRGWALGHENSEAAEKLRAAQ